MTMSAYAINDTIDDVNMYGGEMSGVSFLNYSQSLKHVWLVHSKLPVDAQCCSCKFVIQVSNTRASGRTAPHAESSDDTVMNNLILFCVWMAYIK